MMAFEEYEMFAFRVDCVCVTFDDESEFIKQIDIRG